MQTHSTVRIRMVRHPGKHWKGTQLQMDAAAPAHACTQHPTTRVVTPRSPRVTHILPAPPPVLPAPVHSPGCSHALILLGDKLVNDDNKILTSSQRQERCPSLSGVAALIGTHTKGMGKRAALECSRLWPTNGEALCPLVRSPNGSHHASRTDLCVIFSDQKLHFKTTLVILKQSANDSKDRTKKSFHLQNPEGKVKAELLRGLP